MKTLAVIKNELFKDYLRFVSTNDLPNVLDNPDIPVPFTCVQSVDNTNSDLLLAQLQQYFNHSKVGNKDFYTLNEDTQSQLAFMFNLIKLSSGQPGSETSAQAPLATHNNVTASHLETSSVEPVAVEPVVQSPAAPSIKNALQFLPEQKVETIVDTAIVEPAIVQAPVATPTVVQPVVEASTILEPTAVIQQPNQEVKVNSVVNPEEEVGVFSETEQDDPFGFKTKEEITKAEMAPVLEPVEQPAPVVAPQVTLIDSLGIPQGATIHFIKDANITATLLDEKTVNYDNQNMTLVEAAKAAFKKSGTVGMAVGLSNWNYADETLKSWKEKQLN